MTKRLRTARAADVPRTGARRTVLGVIRRLPDYLRMLGGVMGDARVSKLDRGLVLAAIAYIVLPLDFLPDVIPFLGQVDDVFLLVMALQRLVDRAGRDVLLDHWRGDPDALTDLSFGRVLAAAAFFLPGPIKRRLRRLVRAA